MTSPEPDPDPDPGLPAERTSLAWRRTALAVAVGSLVGLRVLPAQLGALGYAVSALGLLWSVDLALSGRRRYRDAQRILHTGSAESVATAAGGTVARAASTAAALAVLALVAVVVLSIR